jgi:hypothetical protein
MPTPPACNRKIRKVGSRKLPSTGRWENVPIAVQISMQSHILPNMGDQTSVSRKFPAMGQWGNVPGNVRISLHLTYGCKHGRILHVSSWKLPATGRWKNVPRKVQLSSQSHETSLIVMDLGVDESDSCSIDVNTTSLPKRIPQKKVLGNFPQLGDGGTFRERFRSRRISRNPENTGDHTFTSGKLPAAGRWKILLGKV